jgi:LuxR family maltose regulon positive regulatory protein
MTVVSAPAGSGKTLLLRSWMDGGARPGAAAWVPVPGQERDPRRFWRSVLRALEDTPSGARLARPLAADRALDGWAIVERLLAGLGAWPGRVWLVIDDLHELRSAEALRQLELLVRQAPASLRFVLAARHDPRLGLHRLRLQGELTEIRADDLRFTVTEARALFAAAGITLSESALGMLHQRTEGWAAGLRLAALSLDGHRDPDRFATEFSGAERTVAEYLLAEVLDRQPEPVRRLLRRTSVLDRVNGELADLLTGDQGGERVLQQLAQDNAFVVALDARRSWFRYHQLLADLLRLELRGTEPAELPALHAAAASWHAGHGHEVEGIRHAQAAQAWALAVRQDGDPFAAAGQPRPPLVGRTGSAGPSLDGDRALAEPLSRSEIRVLRYLPTKLSVPEIAGQLCLSVNTVKTHMRHLYDKLGVHRRHEAVEQARAVGLLAASPRGR